ncbi:MAG: response regulator [Anaerolinea sp.]|nr:response regulator [Anaerolinea sp.]
MLTASSTLPARQNQLSACLLLVDDDATTLALLKRIFEQEYHLLLARNGEEALALLEDNAVDLILLDVLMPRMDGLTFLQILREEKHMTNIPVIMISANHDTRDVVQGLELGANDYIGKPMNPQIVRARVRTQLALKFNADRQTKMIDDLRYTQDFQNHFYSVLAHDLKGPLTNLRLGQYMLREFVEGKPEANTILDNLDLTLNSMLEMIHTFMDAARYQQGAYTVQTEPVSLRDVCTRVIEQYLPAARAKSICIEIEPDDFPVLADRVMVTQMFSNLISNALKFSDRGAHVHVWKERRDDKVRIHVLDHGPGIPLEERDSLFGMFSRLSPRPTGQESSTGLGLWIVKNLAALQHGEVGASFPPDGGSVFWFELPAA